MPFEPLQQTTQQTEGYFVPLENVSNPKSDFVPKGNDDIEKEYYFDQYQTGRKENSYFGGIPIVSPLAREFESFARGGAAEVIKLPQIWQQLNIQSAEEEKQRLLDRSGYRFLKSKEDIDARVQYLDRTIAASKKILEKQRERFKQSGLAKRPDESYSYDVGGGFSSVLQAVGLSILTKSTIPASVYFGTQTMSNIYTERREAGKPVENASRVASITGIVSGGIERLGLEALLGIAKKSGVVQKAGYEAFKKFIKPGLKSGATEFTEESLQQVAEEVAQSDVRDTSLYDKFKNVFGAGILGFIAGGTVGMGLAVSSYAEREGIDPEKAKAAFKEVLNEGISDNALSAKHRYVEKGEGTKLFHGTSRDFENFDVIGGTAKNRYGKILNNPFYYFSDKPEIAVSFSRNTGSRKDVSFYRFAKQEGIEDIPNSFLRDVQNGNIEKYKGEDFYDSFIDFKKEIQKSIDKGYIFKYIDPISGEEKETNDVNFIAKEASNEDAFVQTINPKRKERVIESTIYGNVIDLSSKEGYNKLDENIKTSLKEIGINGPLPTIDFSHEGYGYKLINLLEKYGVGAIKVPDVYESGFYSYIVNPKFIGENFDKYFNNKLSVNVQKAIDDVIMRLEKEANGNFDTPESQQEIIKNLQESPARQQIREKSLEQWAAGTKVVDEQGKPLVVYHGTADDIKYFNIQDPFKKDSGHLGNGIYFTPSTNIASSYSFIKSGRDYPNVMPVYLNVKNPLILSYKEGIELKERLRENTEATIDFTIEKKRDGFDGVVWNDGSRKPTEIVAFDSKQVKSVYSPYFDNNSNLLSDPVPDALLKQTMEEMKTNDDEQIKQENVQKQKEFIQNDYKKAIAIQKAERRFRNRIVSSVEDFGESTVDWVDYALSPVSTSAASVSPKIKYAIKKFLYSKNKAIQKSEQSIKGFMDLSQKMDGDDYLILDRSLMNADAETTSAILKKYGMEEAYKNVQNELERLRIAAAEVGIDIGTIENYFPRRVSNYPEFLDFLRGTEQWSSIEDAIKKADPNNIFTEEDKAKFADNYIRGYVPDKIALSRPDSSKSRTIEYVTPEMQRFYKSSFTALKEHINSMNEAIETRRFLGKESTEITDLSKRRKALANRIKETEKENASEIKRKELGRLHAMSDALGRQIELGAEDIEVIKEQKKENDEWIEKISKIKPEGVKKIVLNRINKNLSEVEARLSVSDRTNVEDSIGMYVRQLVENKEINARDEAFVKRLITSVVTPKGLQGAVRVLNNATYIYTMGGVQSTIRQIGDIGLSIYQNGLYRTGKGIIKTFTPKSVTLKDVGIDSIIQEYTDNKDGSFSEAAVRKTFMATGLSVFDKFIAKHSTLNAEFDRLKSWAKKSVKGKSKPDFEQKLKDIFGDNSEQVKQDLVDGVLSEDVKYLLFCELSELQPIDLAELPAGHNLGGNARAFYTLKKYTLKVLDVYRREVTQKMRTHPIEATRNFISLTTSLALTNMAADALIAFMFGKAFDLGDAVVENIMRIFGFGRYDVYQAKRDGPIQVVLKETLMPAGLGAPIDTIYKDLTKEDYIEDWYIWNRVPVFGSFYYWWFGGGADK